MLPHWALLRETRPLDDLLRARWISIAKEQSDAKDAFEPIDHTAISSTVLPETDEIQHVTGFVNSDEMARLLQGEGGHPDGDLPVLSKRQTKPRMSDNLEEVLPLVGVGGNSTYHGVF